MTHIRIASTAAAAIALLAITHLPAAATAATREELLSVPASPQVQAEIDAYRIFDPSARFQLVRGHVDAFSAHPKSTVPNYAREILEQAGLNTDPVAQPRVPTTEEPAKTEAPQDLPREADPGADDGNDGDDDSGDADDQLPVDDDTHTGQDQWYGQEGKEVVEPILREFLRRNARLFEMRQQHLAEGLPTLDLVRYGVGKHFRRAEFTQRLGRVPVLDSKTLVLFDLNWNVVGISQQLFTPQKLDLELARPISFQQARALALDALGLDAEDARLMGSELGIDPIRQTIAWIFQIEDLEDLSEFTVQLRGSDGVVLNISDDTARYNDAQVKRWDYTGGDMTMATRVDTVNVYTHDDNTLVHDFFYLVNDDRNDGGTGVCSDTSPDSNSTPNAYGTTNSSEYVRPTRRSDRDFTLWNPQAAKGSFGESHAYYWGRKYVQWQKQALVDLGLLTLGNFNNYTKALIIVNACDDGAGNYKGSLSVSTMDDLGEGLGTIRLPERCRSGNGNCSATDYADSNSGNLYTYEGDGGYHFPGVIHHELNHFLMIEYLGVDNGKDCNNFKEHKYFQEGGLGRVLPQIYWASKYDLVPSDVDYLPDTTNKLFRSNGTSGEIHDESDSSTLHDLSSFACGTDNGDPYAWGIPVVQPMWEIYHGQKIEGAIRFSMARPAQDKGMIKSAYYAADMASASFFKDRWEVANRFMEFWELFSTAVPDTKEDWCEVWGHHGMDTFIAASFCS